MQMLCLSTSIVAFSPWALKVPSLPGECPTGLLQHNWGLEEFVVTSTPIFLLSLLQEFQEKIRNLKISPT